MTSWSVPGSPVRYYQCPFCTRTFSSHYGEVFRSLAGARRVERAPAEAPAACAAPLATAEEIRWKALKTRAARWFARVEADERRCAVSYAAPRSARAPSRHR